MNPKPRGVRSIDEDKRLRDVQERLDAQAPVTTRCPTHQQSTPHGTCGACRADHLAEGHGSRVATCALCELQEPKTDVVDVRALAAGEPRPTSFADRSSES